MDLELWKKQVPKQAESDGLTRSRSRVLEALLEAYADSEVDAPLPVGSTFGTVERGGCRVYLSKAVCRRAEKRWRRENPDRRGGESPGFGLLCEVLLREYVEARAELRITAVPTDTSTRNEAA